MKLCLSRPHVSPAFAIVVLVCVAISGLLGVADGAAVTRKVRRNQIRNYTNASPEVFMVSETGNRQEILVDEGETVYISCSLNKTIVRGCEWFKKSSHGGKGKQITQFFDRYQKITPCQLQIRSVNYDDAGIIVCKTTTDSSESATYTSQITVTGEDDPFGNTLPKPSSSDSGKGYIAYSEPAILKDLFQPDGVYIVHKGENFVFKCEASGHPKPMVSWKKGNKVYTPPTEGYSSLKLTNLTEDDSGVYKCEAINLFGKTEQEITLKVRGALQGFSEILEVTPRNLTLYEGSEGNITCIARFPGDPFFAWVRKIENKTGETNTFSYEGHDYAVLKRTEIRPLGQQLFATSLILKNVSSFHSGMYHCLIAGLQGYNHSEAYVIVEKDPAKLHMAQNRRHKAVTGLGIFSFLIFATLVILCIIKVYGCPTAGSRKLSSQGSLQSNSTTKKTQLPKRSPETLSTDCTHPQLEVLHPLVTHGSCSLASQEPSVRFKDCTSSCRTYNSYDPEYSVANSSIGDDSFVIADLEAARSSFSLAASVCDSEFCSKQAATASPRTQTSDYYTRRQSRRDYRSHQPYPHQHKHRHQLHYLYHPVKSSSENNPASHHLPQYDSANHCPSCIPENCSCHSLEPSNLSTLSSDCHSRLYPYQLPRVHLPQSHHHHHHPHQQPYYPAEYDEDYMNVAADDCHHGAINEIRKLNPSPLSFLEQLHTNPNAIIL